MRIEEHLAMEFYENHIDEIKELILKAYSEGYSQGLKKLSDIKADGVRFHDLGLPSGTLWSEPIHKSPPGCYYYNYILETYNNVCEFSLPSLEDFQELLQHCKFSFNDASRSEEVNIIGPSGKIIRIDTKSFPNRPGVQGTHTCCRRGEGVSEGLNMFWLQSEIQDNQACVGVVDVNDKALYPSIHFTGYRLPYLLVKKLK